MKIEIKARFTGAVLFAHDCDDNTLRITCEAAVKARADLSGADLSGADLSGKKLIGERPFLQIGPIGSRSDYLIACLTDAGIYIRTGCFDGSRTEFVAAIADTHGGTCHGDEYMAALALIDAHAKLWMPKDALKAAA